MRTMRKLIPALAALLALLLALPALAAGEELSATLGVEIDLVGTPPETAEDYTVRMTAEGEYPMPGGGVGGSYDLTVTGGGKAVFPEITFDNVGIYTYTVRQLAGSEPTAITYDATEYDLKITCYRDESDTLRLAVALREKDNDEKTAQADFLNEYAVERIALTVTKVWDDNENQDGIRPENLTVTLSDGQTVTLSAANNWTATVEELPRFEENTRNEIAYTWTEAAVEGYELTAEVTAEGVTTLTNTHVPETTALTVTKVWNDAANPQNRPAALNVTLLANGEEAGAVTLNAANGWTATLEDLPVYAAGEAIVYAWQEAAVANYTQTALVTTDTTTTITNTRNPETGDYELTVYYRYLNGGTAAPTVTERHNAGENYDVASPTIAGYRVTMARVTGTMPTRNVEYTVFYIPNNVIIIDDFDTPLGLGQVYINVGDCLE